MAVETRGGRRVGGEEQVEAVVERPHLRQDRTPLPARAQIVLGGEQARGEAARPEVLPERSGPGDQLRQVQREQLALGADDLHVGIGLQRAQRHVLDDGPQLAEDRDGALQRRRQLRMDLQVLLPEMPHHADAQAFDTQVDAGGEVGRPLRRRDRPDRSRRWR